MASGGDQRNGAHSVVHQFFGKFAACHSGIADGEVESVGNRIAQVIVIYQIETVTKENLF